MFRAVIYGVRLAIPYGVVANAFIVWRAARVEPAG
jgi:hypothetical protein